MGGLWKAALVELVESYRSFEGGLRETALVELVESYQNF